MLSLTKFSSLPQHHFLKTVCFGLVIAIPALAITVTFRTFRTSAKPSPHHAKVISQGQTGAQPRDRTLNRLALQPQADRLRRRLGQRFSQAGRETATLVGTAIVGTERYAIRLVRNQDDNDERLTISLNGDQSQLSWSGLGGGRSGVNPVAANLRAFVERLALDSPDQFILAQLRGASYFTVAQNVRPVGAPDDYAGPIWNVVRISEPVASPQASKPQSSARLYFINTVTGLIDKVVSQEAADTITAEFSSWVNQNGELTPTRVFWKKDKEVIMEFALTSVSYTAK